MNPYPENGNASSGGSETGGGVGKTLSKGAQNMKHITENVKTFPIPDSHLTGAAVLACSILDHQGATVDCRQQLESLQQAVSEIWRIGHNLSDLFHQMDTALQLAVAAREHPVFKAPDWFFQAEGTDHEKMLTRRARYLKAAKLDLDSAWDVLREFGTDVLRIKDPDAPVREVVRLPMAALKCGPNASACRAQARIGSRGMQQRS